MKILRNIVLVIAVVVISGTMGLCSATKKTVAVMPLENVSGYSEQRVAEIMTEELVRVLHKSGKYVVVERNQLANALREAGFGMTGAVDQGTAVQVGKTLGAQYSIIGKVTMATIGANMGGNLANAFLGIRLADTLNGQVTVDIRMINNETGEVVVAESVNGDKKGSSSEFVITRSCQEAAENFLKCLHDGDGAFGHVLSVEGDIVYIDRGKESGVRKGDTLIVVREGSPILDMEGNIIAVNTTTVGKLKVTEANDGYAICRITDRNSLGAISRGALVKWGK